MTSCNMLFGVVLFLIISTAVNGFVPSVARQQQKHQKMLMVPFAVADIATLSPVIFDQQQVYQSTTSSSSVLQSGIKDYMQQQPKLDSMSSSTNLLSLQEIKKVSKEELAAKKNTFNLIFWGGGFVAPFIATVFYFGFKFWEK